MWRTKYGEHCLACVTVRLRECDEGDIAVMNMNEMLRYYADGNRWIAKQGENHAWETFKTKRAAYDYALDGRTESQALRAGASVERLADMILFELEDLGPDERLSLTLGEIVALAKILQTARKEICDYLASGGRSHSDEACKS